MLFKIGGGPVAAAVLQSSVEVPLTDHMDIIPPLKDTTIARKARYNEAELIGMLSDVDSDDGDYLDEAMCPGATMNSLAQIATMRGTP